MTRAAVAVGGRGAQHVQRPLPAVGERQPDSCPAGALHAEREGPSRLLRGDAAAKLVRAAEDGRVARHDERISSAARSATITVGQLV